MDELLNISRKKIEETSEKFSRFILDSIDVERQLIGIIGARGSGKSTLLLQLLKQQSANEVLYVSLDNLYFSSNALYDLASVFSKFGGKYLYVDEVHKYPNWSQEIKNIYDSYTDLRVVFTGSSALKINQGKHDLSRRALIFNLPGLSFREFLELKYDIELPVRALENILVNHKEIAADILKKIKPFKYFSEYLRSGYYPFFMKEGEFYFQQLQETINLVIETDLPAIYNIDFASTLKLKKLLYVMCTMGPYIPNVNKLAQHVGTTRDSLLRFLYLLHNAHILKWLGSDVTGINFMNKPEKLYLENTNIGFSLRKENNVGMVRETFFLNQLSQNHSVTYPKRGDFLVDEKYLFEIGDKGKDYKQISGIDNSFIAADDIEYGFGNKIPLWLFGFLY